MKAIRYVTVLVAALTAVSATAAGAAPVREFEGTVASVNRDAKTFRLKDVERGTVRIKVTRDTRFERIADFGALKARAKRIEATVKRKNGAWVALEVEHSGGGGEHGGDGDDGGDDR
jgi:hypothetical protein